MKISELIEHLNSIKQINGDISVRVEVDYIAYDDNASKSGPVLHRPLIWQDKESDEDMAVIWADADYS